MSNREKRGARLPSILKLPRYIRRSCKNLPRIEGRGGRGVIDEFRQEKGSPVDSSVSTVASCIFAVATSVLAGERPISPCSTEAKSPSTSQKKSISAKNSNPKKVPQPRFSSRILRVKPPSYDSTSWLTSPAMTKLNPSTRSAIIRIVDDEVIDADFRLSRVKNSKSNGEDAAANKPIRHAAALSATRESCIHAAMTFLICRVETYPPDFGPMMIQGLQDHVISVADAADGTPCQASTVASLTAIAMGNVVMRVLDRLGDIIELHILANEYCRLCNEAAIMLSEEILAGNWPLPPEGVRRPREDIERQPDKNSD